MKIQDFVLEGHAARESLNGLLLHSGILDSSESVNALIRYLLPENETRRLRLLDLEPLFHFVLFGKHLLVIPRANLSAKNVLVHLDFTTSGLSHFQHVEFVKEQILSTALRIAPDMPLIQYLKLYARSLLRRKIANGEVEKAFTLNAGGSSEKACARKS